MTRTIVVAYNENFVIGDNMGKVPWHVPEDFKFFKETTMGHPCIMGRTTWDSLPVKFRPLPGRVNIIVTRKPHTFEIPEGKDNVIVASSVESAVVKAMKLDDQIFITGGQKIYEYCLEWRLVDRVLASEIKNQADVVGATFFPDLKQKGWKGTLLKEFADFNVVEYTPQ